MVEVPRKFVDPWEQQAASPVLPLPRQTRLPQSDDLVTENGLYHILMMVLLSGQVVVRLLTGRCERRKLMEHLISAGPRTLMPVLATNLFAGMIFTIQSAREMMQYGLAEIVGQTFAVAFCRELAPILTAAVLTCQVGSAFAAELASMKLTEQIDALKMMRTDPIDYLVMPRVLACAVMLPVLSIVGIFVGVAGGGLVADQMFGVTSLSFLGGIRSSITVADVLTLVAKSMFFGGAIAVASCSRGLTASCHGRGVGQAATSAVVTAWVMLFVLDFILTIGLMLLDGLVSG
jgi:phospholipid/cholesterol/gamma-HCH transport system permease protein